MFAELSNALQVSASASSSFSYPSPSPRYAWRSVSYLLYNVSSSATLTLSLTFCDLSALTIIIGAPSHQPYTATTWKLGHQLNRVSTSVTTRPRSTEFATAPAVRLEFEDAGEREGILPHTPAPVGSFDPRCDIRSNRHCAARRR